MKSLLTKSAQDANSADEDSLQLNAAVMAAADIMMVDDEPLNMEVLQIHLESEGYSNFTAISDSTLALDAIHEQRPDVVLLDLVMPEVSGFDILSAMRVDPELKHTPVIVLTSSDDSETKLKALQLGATDFLAKPVNESELALRMRNTLAARAYQQRMMYLDALTNLPNRLFFTGTIRNSIQNFSSAEDESTMVLVNIDRFKMINDSLGPDRGDDVLWTFSQRLMTAFDITETTSTTYTGHEKQSCLAARIGGDRFAVLVPSSTAQSDLAVRLDSFVEAMELPMVVSGQDIYVNVSIGVSQLTKLTESVEQLINDAETAMLYARRSHAVHYAFYSENMNDKAHEILSIENGLRTAVDNNEIFVVYQPKVDVAGHFIAGAEVLVRWDHPEFGLISPVDFISIAEDSGMIVSIGEWVLREACQQTVAWRKLGYSDFKIAVNVSIRQLHEQDFVAFVDSVLKETQLPPSALIIELTENMIMDNAEGNILKLQSLKDLGVEISIDDFGTGYSSLSYLQRFPIDQLKIDRSFIREIKHARDSHPIVKAVISLAHDLGMTVVAEGVETAHQLAHIHSVGCEEYQGFLCSRPVVGEEFEAMLTESIKRSA